MKRKISQESETSKRTKPVGNDSLVWELVIKKLDYRTLMMLSQQNRLLACIVDRYAEHKLEKVRCRLQEDKYLWVYFTLSKKKFTFCEFTLFKWFALSKSDLNFSGRKFSNPASWSQYRALNHIFEGENALQGKSHQHTK